MSELDDLLSKIPAGNPESIIVDARVARMIVDMNTPRGTLHYLDLADIAKRAAANVWRLVQ